MLQQKTKVFLDTNFLLIPGRHKVDIFTQIEDLLSEPFEFIVLSKTIDELDGIIAESKKMEDRKAAKLAILLIKQKSLKMARSFSKGSVDDILVEKSTHKDYVATQDKELRKRLKEKRVSILGLRQMKRVVKEA